MYAAAGHASSKEEEELAVPFPLPRARRLVGALCVGLVLAAAQHGVHGEDSALVLNRTEGPEEVMYCRHFDSVSLYHQVTSRLLESRQIGERVPSAIALGIVEETGVVAPDCTFETATYVPLDEVRSGGYPILEGRDFDYVPDAEGDHAECGDLAASNGRCSLVVVPNTFVPALLDGSETIVFIATARPVLDPERGRIYGAGAAR